MSRRQEEEKESGSTLARVQDASGEAVEKPVPGDEPLLADIRTLIEATRQHAARVVNSAMVFTYWSIGERIQREVLGEERAEYGKQVVERLADRLAAEYGSGFSRANLFRMLRFAQAFPDSDIVATLSRQLAWSHFVELLALDESIKREFYAQMCFTERWSVRTLRSKIQGMLFERTAISRKPEELAVRELEALRDEERMSPDLVFRDPYFLDFLGLRDAYDERDLERAASGWPSTSPSCRRKQCSRRSSTRRSRPRASGSPPGRAAGHRKSNTMPLRQDPSFLRAGECESPPDR